jgi:hypothetical protein
MSSSRWVSDNRRSTDRATSVLERERKVIAPERLELAVVGHLVPQVEAVGDRPGRLVVQAVPQRSDIEARGSTHPTRASTGGLRATAVSR